MSICLFENGSDTCGYCIKSASDERTHQLFCNLPSSELFKFPIDPQLTPRQNAIQGQPDPTIEEVEYETE